MKKLLIPLLVTVGLLTACEKQIVIDIEDMEPRLVVDALGTTGAPLSIGITESRPVFGPHTDEEGFPRIADATVTLTANGTVYNASLVDDRYILPYSPQGGDRLTLQIDMPGRPSVSAEATVPAEPLVGEVSFPALDIDNPSNALSFFVTITDRAASNDYYYITLTRFDTIYLTYYSIDSLPIQIDTIYDSETTFECDDPLVVTDMNVIDMIGEMGMSTYYGQQLLFNDERLDGHTHTIELNTYNPVAGYYYGADYNNYTYEIHCTYVLEMGSVSHDTYLYLKTRQAARDNDALLNLLSEPVQVHSNIEGGIGIFGVSNRKVFTHHTVYRP
jgi:hypothetical protein